MIQGVVKFYREIVAPFDIDIEPEGIKKTILPLTRVDFLVCSGRSTLLLVKNVALSIFFQVLNICTCFLRPNLRSALLLNTGVIPIYFSAIPLGLMGAIIPQTINEKILHLPFTQRVMEVRFPVRIGN